MKKRVFITLTSIPIIALLCILRFPTNQNTEFIVPNKIKNYCKNNGYNTKYCIMVNYSIPSGTERFFCIDTSKNRIITSSICLHGNGKGNTPSKPYFSNKINSHCSSLGKYKIVGAYWMKYYGIPVLKLRGLDKTNSNAEKRAIYVHPAITPIIAHYFKHPKYLPLTIESEGCFSIDYKCFNKIRQIVNKSDKPILLYAYT